jgi:hypothetical protein
MSHCTNADCQWLYETMMLRMMKVQVLSIRKQRIRRRSLWMLMTRPRRSLERFNLLVGSLVSSSETGERMSYLAGVRYTADHQIRLSSRPIIPISSSPYLPVPTNCIRNPFISIITSNQTSNPTSTPANRPKDPSHHRFLVRQLSLPRWAFRPITR